MPFKEFAERLYSSKRMKQRSKYQHILSTGLSIIVPGLGHFFLGHWVEGFILSFLYAMALDGFLVSIFVRPGRFVAALPITLLIVLAAIWITAQVLFVLKVRSEEEIDLERRDRLFKNYIIAYLKNDLDEARHLLNRILDMDNEDVDALFHLSQLLKLTGDKGGAGKLAKRCRDLDEDAKWKWELQEEKVAPKAEEEA
jgi:hypothetical protein